MSGKLFIKTHGCQMNEYDSDKMVDVLAASHGLEITDNESEADVILIDPMLATGGSAGDAFADIETSGPQLPPHLQAAHDAGRTTG